MGKRYLLDTNFVIYFLGGILPENALSFSKEILQQRANLSVISKIELLSWNYSDALQEEKLNSFLSNSTIIHIDDEIINQAISIRKQTKKIKLPDAIIAATALTHTLSLVTRNTDDFSSISSLETYQSIYF
jgi:predicted nucleic acid-binding protein